MDSFKIVETWINREPGFKDSRKYFSNYVNSDNNEILEINMENSAKIGLVLVYGDGFVHIDIHDKLTANPLYIRSLSFSGISDLITILKKNLLEQW